MTVFFMNLCHSYKIICMGTYFASIWFFGSEALTGSILFLTVGFAWISHSQIIHIFPQQLEILVYLLSAWLPLAFAVKTTSTIMHHSSWPLQRLPQPCVNPAAELSQVVLHWYTVHFTVKRNGCDDNAHIFFCAQVTGILNPKARDVIFHSLPANTVWMIE